VNAKDDDTVGKARMPAGDPALARNRPPLLTRTSGRSNLFAGVAEAVNFAAGPAKSAESCFRAELLGGTSVVQ
jgi:hypothetical protein